jgi:MraZ protein
MWGKNMFRGITSINIDDKGRFAIPARYREELMDQDAGKLVVTIDTQERCLLLYPVKQWELIEKKLEVLPSFNPVTRRIQRLLIGHATELEIDKQGRVLLPPLLRDYASLEKTIMLVGQGKKFEIWGEKQWDDGRASWLNEHAIGQSEMPPELNDLSV